MKNKILAAIVLAVAALGVRNAAAQSCDVVGIKPTKEFLKKNQRQCFPTAKAATAKKFTPFDATALVGFNFSLSGAQEVPPVTTAASGKCLATFNRQTKTLDVLCTHTASDPNAVHVHEGPAGVDGAIICDLGNGVSPIAGSCVLSATQVTSLFSAGLYVNVHTVANTGGELRGQID